MRQSLSTWKPAALGFSTILPYSAAFTCMKGMTVIVLMWEEAAIKDDVIEYDIAFNIIYIMRTHVVSTKRYCRLSTIHTRRVR